MKPIVAIVGRPNVGKSSLFNKLIGRHKAIVVDEPGVTRDLNFADMEEFGKAFTLVDTGGFESVTEDRIMRQVREQTRLAIEDSDVIVFLMDGRTGPTADDQEIVELLRKVSRPVIYAVNKLDTTRLDANLGDFYALGITAVIPVSAEHGRGLNELVDAVIENLPERQVVEDTEERVRVSIVGRPNVGKSSLLNRIIGKERSIVSDIAGTTRDPVDMPFDAGGKKYLFIDTAGIRKKNRVSLTVESYCVMEAIKSIERSDVAILVLDGKLGVQGQDEKIAGLIEDRKKCCVIIVNKWDLVEKETHTVEYAKEAIHNKLPFLAFAPVLFTSALTGQRVPKVLETIDAVVEKSRTRITTSNLNNVFESIQTRHRPSVYKGKEVKFYYITQSGVAPPTFVIFTNWPEGVTEPYKRYIVNSLREALGLDNVPIRVLYRKRQ
ncbi:MAG: ribosome biogenesis GTPase Der [Deltaproteobacteria bacterium]|nr:ribosome biogenesis GTPase Der [Deltaproteobacteria bacterium]